MCFSPQKKNYQNNILKLYNDKKLKDNLTKVEILLLSNKHLISRNYEKLKKNSFYKDTNKDNNKIGLFFQTNQKILNQSFFNKNKNSLTNNYKLADKKLICSYSFRKKILSPNNISKGIKKDSNYFYDNLSDKISKQINSKKDNINKNKTNKRNSVLNIKNINVNHKTNNNNKYDLGLNKIINIIKNNSGNTRNNIKKNSHNNNQKFSFSPGVSRINSLNLNLTTRTKSRYFSHSPSINLSSSNANMNLSDNMRVCKKTAIFSSENKKYNNKNRNITKYNDIILFKNKLKKSFFKYINIDLSKSKEKKKESLSLFDKLYAKLTEKSLKQINPFLFKKKSKRSSSYSNFNIIKYNNKNNKIENDIINSNEIATSGSINFTSQDELSSEEIHFKAIKYYQEIKKNCEFFE